MKTYSQTNFFKHTFCEFQQVDAFNFPKDTNYKSKSNSYYFYTKEGVYRKSNHWGRVANCRWKLISNGNYKNQQTVIAFAKWSDFFPINSSEKMFFIIVDFDKKTAMVRPKKEKPIQHLFTYLESVKRVKQINLLLKNDAWARYFNVDIKTARETIILDFINSDRNLNQIKQSLSFFHD